MPGQQDNNWNEQINRAIADLLASGQSASKLAAEAFGVMADEMVGAATEAGYVASKEAQRVAEQSTETIGRVVTPIMDNPFTQYAAKVPGLKWLMAAMGKINIPEAQGSIDQLQSTYPTEVPEQLAQRVIVNTALTAGGIGLITNIVPSVALTLFAVDIVAVTALQAEMVYRIAGLYGFSLQDPARRGEVLAIFGLAMVTSGALKFGLSFAEAVPVIGPAIGASSDAALIYGLGQIACRFYEAKRRSL
jgi:uncharacterized protein (DUF697 family)